MVWYGVVLCSVVWLQCRKIAANGLEGSILLCLLFSETSTEARTMDIGEIHSRVDNWRPFQGLFMCGRGGRGVFRNESWVSKRSEGRVQGHGVQ